MAKIGVAAYKLVPGGILRTADNVTFSKDDGSQAARDFMAWYATNQPDPADVPDSTDPRITKIIAALIRKGYLVSADIA